jgi:hypothetical protein
MFASGLLGRVALAVLVVVSVATTTSRHVLAHGNDSDPMTIVLRSGDSLSEDTFGRIAVLVSGVECAGASTVQEEASGTTISLGSADQDQSCAQPGARITFVVGSGKTLFAETVFSPGGTFVLDNFAPLPPQDGLSANEAVVGDNNSGVLDTGLARQLAVLGAGALVLGSILRGRRRGGARGLV